MKIVIAAGTGQVGRILVRALQPAGHEIVILTRNPHPTPLGDASRVVTWNPAQVCDWSREVDGADVLINLAGRSVNCRYTAANKMEILRSRVDSVRTIGQAIQRAASPPRVWLQASTATIYRHTFGEPNDEENGVIGGGEPDTPASWKFSVDVAQAWENATREWFVELPWTRIVRLRSSMILSPDRYGVFHTLLRLVKLGLGGHVGSGRQYISWIHEADFARAVMWLIRDDTMPGAVNVAAPHPLPNREFMRELRKAWGMPIGLPAIGPMVDLGAVMMGTEPELILKSRRVVPGRLMDRGFRFRFPTWPAAAADLCQRSRRGTRLS